MPKATVSDSQPRNLPSTSTGKLPASYESAQTELRQLLDQLESGNTPLSDLLGSYRRGAELLDYCRAQLQAIEEQVKVLDGKLLRPLQPK